MKKTLEADRILTQETNQNECKRSGEAENQARRKLKVAGRKRTQEDRKDLCKKTFEGLGVFVFPAHDSAMHAPVDALISCDKVMEWLWRDDG